MRPAVGRTLLSSSEVLLLRGGGSSSHGSGDALACARLFGKQQARGLSELAGGGEGACSTAPADQRAGAAPGSEQAHSACGKRGSSTGLLPRVAVAWAAGGVCGLLS